MTDTKVSIDNLLIVDVPHASRISTQGVSWKSGVFFPAEECDRQLLIGAVEDEKDIPEEIRAAAVPAKGATKDTTVIIDTRAEAYRHLLNVATGMLDKHLGEKETIEGIRSKWLDFIKRNADSPERKEKFDQIMQAVFADSRAIRTKVFEDRVGDNYLRPVSSEPAVAARNMLDINPSDQVLIIGEKDGITVNTLKAIDVAYRKQAEDGAGKGGIIITHPDAAEFEKLKSAVSQLRKDKKLKSNVECIPYEEAMRSTFPQADFVFNCQPMDNGAKDAQLINKLEEREKPTAILINLKGVPQNRNRTSETWAQSGSQRVFFIEDIERQAELDRVHNQRAREMAELAIENCIASRLMHRQPVKNRLLMPAEEYAAFIHNLGSAPNESHTQAEQERRAQSSGIKRS